MRTLEITPASELTIGDLVYWVDHFDLVTGITIDGNSMQVIVLRQFMYDDEPHREASFRCRYDTDLRIIRE